MNPSIAAYHADLLAPRKPRAKPRRLEDDFHKQVRKYLSAVIADPGITSQHGVLWYAVETRAKRSLREGAANKARGAISGCCDIDIYCAGRAYKIELKSAKGKLSDAQRNLHRELAAASVPVVVAFTLDDVRDALRAWGVPVRGV